MPLQSSLKERSTMGPRLTFGYAASLFLFCFDFGFALFGFDSCHHTVLSLLMLRGSGHAGAVVVRGHLGQVWAAT